MNKIQTCTMANNDTYTHTGCLINSVFLNSLLPVLCQCFLYFRNQTCLFQVALHQIVSTPSTQLECFMKKLSKIGIERPSFVNLIFSLLFCLFTDFHVFLLQKSVSKLNKYSADLAPNSLLGEVHF